MKEFFEMVIEEEEKVREEEMNKLFNKMEVEENGI